MITMAKKVLLIGWDAADWKVINPLLDSGKMPALAKIINNGVIGNLATLDPPLSPMLWTSISTGKRADKHGIIGFMEPDLKNGGVRPINITSRKTRAIWNILTHAGKKCNVIGWWPSHPAEPINGVMVSNFFQAQHRKGNNLRPKPLPKGCIHPKEMVKKLKRFRIHQTELTQAHLLPFLPKATEYYNKPDYAEKYEKRVSALAKILSENASIHAATTWLMENTEWDMTAVYFDGIDHASHGFMHFHPPQLPGMPNDLFDLFKGVVSGMYIFHDMMLERLMQLAGEDTTVIIISDHGFHPDHLRKAELPKHAAAPALEHRPYGIICMAGNNIHKDERIYGATLLDITPTILNMFGLSIGKDMDGKVLSSAFETPVIPEYIESWDTVEGDFGTHSADMQEDSFASAEAMKQLIELGYVEDFGEDKAKAMENTVIESKYNLARVYMSKNDFTNAVLLLEELVAAKETDARFILALSKCTLSLKKYDKTLELLTRMRNIEEKHKPNVDLLEAMVYSQQGKYKKAFEILDRIGREKFLGINFLCELGKVFLKINKTEDALNAFEDVLKIDDANAYAHFGIGQVCMKSGNMEEAAECFLNTTGLQYFNPVAHCKLGETLCHLKKYNEAAHAFEVALSQAPKMIRARRWLQKIYSENLDDKKNAEKQKEMISSLTKGTVYVVSGLPRSGTSMMMQMLESGGLQIFKDDKRIPDDNNPKGYHEHELVKSLARDRSWLPQAEGKAVKIIAQLLFYLPANFNYKIIFMERDMDEVIISQQKMLGKKTDTFPLKLADTFNITIEKVKKWAQESHNVEMLYINYHDTVETPSETTEKVCSFLNLQLDSENMDQAVMAELYRNKKQNEE
jgi:predicted AlkP superfamily phosphohydrolase/phosphomutase/tetratricopeptide (TPR) repeat protein